MSSFINEMAVDLGIPPKRLRHVIRTAPLRYKVFYIKKRSGGRREVAQPAREVKAIQRWLMTKLAATLPLHKAATAYVRGSSIKKTRARTFRTHTFLKWILRIFFLPSRPLI